MSKIQKKISLFLIAILILIICQNTNFFKNLYDVTSKNHDSRQQEMNDFCELFGTGYVFYIKNKFNLNYSPKIENYIQSPKQYWIFNKNYKKIDEEKLIILNKTKNIKLKNNDFKILDNFRDRCLYMVKK
tara:strand:- start:498 stop:887 length:390 start_codon:yes stop_codon:yes gene_type:complete